MTPTEAKQKVLSVYPDAKCQQRGVLCYIQDGYDGEAIGFSVHSFEDAWINAAKNIEHGK